VLLIEAGESNLNNPWVFRPGIYPRNMKLDSKTASFYESRPSKWLAGRKAVVPCAHILGGGSSINFMMYSEFPFFPPLFLGVFFLSSSFPSYIGD
jgi:alcohol oxidase